MSIPIIHPSFAAGELAPTLFGRTDLAKYKIGASVARNCFVNFRGALSSRAGTAFVGQCRQKASASSTPPKIVRFQFSIYQSYILEFGDGYMRVVANGAFVTDTPLAIGGASNTDPASIKVPGNPWAFNDWIYVTGIEGTTQLNGRTYIISNLFGDSVQLSDTFGNPVNATMYGAYISGGTAARIYTNYNSPYAAEDLPFLKVIQSADVMSLCCVNTITGKEYPPYDLKRLAANNFEFEALTFAASIAAPATCTATATTLTPVSGGQQLPSQYAYVVTAVSAATGEESIASPIAFITNSVDISLYLGSHTITWSTVAGAAYYNIYQAPESYDTPVPVGSVFGYVGTSFGNQFTNSNITVDESTTPPLHLNPFARGAILDVEIISPGSGLSQSTVTYSIVTSTGSGFDGIPVIVSGALAGFFVQDGGEDYEPTDTITIGGGAASHASGTYTFAGNPTNGQTIDLNGATWTFVTSGATGDQTNIQGTVQATVYQLITDLTNSTDPLIDVAGYSANGLVVTITYGTGGTIGNSYTLGAGSYGGTISGATLTGGAAGGGSGAVAQLVVGPQTGTYPGVVNYFQQRRVYAATIQNPDTYFMSQPGAYLNFDAAVPPIASDAITGTPWGEQVNGVQWLQPMPGGLIAATGLDAWQVSGTQGAGSIIAPGAQSAQPQESNGFSPTVRVLKVNYDILYVSQQNSIIYDLAYNFWNNIYAGVDISFQSNHLFQGYLIEQWAWAKQPWKLIWATRSDGKFLSLTYLKEQELIAWTRHDTNGLVVGNEVASESPVDAPYFVVERYIVGEEQWAYYIERMDNRLWEGAESAWCVDAGLSLQQPAPDATLSAAAADGPGIITGAYLAEGGNGYTAPSANVVDPAGTGSGGSFTLTFTVGGPITGFTFTPGQNYSPGTYVKISDPTGAGATLVLFVSQNVLFNASGGVFGSTKIGDVIRIGGGSASVTEVNSSTQVTASINVPIVRTIPNDPNMLPIPAGPGDWSITTPVKTLTNLGHLEGMEVSVLADGAVVAGGEQPTLTVVNGTITLPVAASSIVVGLPFIAQAQSMYADMAGVPTVQGRRKKVVSGILRMEKSRGVQIGCDQPIASTLPYQQEIPWTGMQDLPEVANVNVPAAALPLFTGDKTAVFQSGWTNWNGFEPSPGCICAQQTNPLPMDVLALILNLEVGDTPSE